MDKDDIEELNASDVESEIDSVVTEEDLDIVNLDEEPDDNEVVIDDEEEQDYDDEDKDKDDEDKDDDDDDDDDDNEVKNDKMLITQDDISDDEEYDEDYFQKLDKETHEEIQNKYHPELKIHNSDEIEVSCKIVRDSNGNIIDPLHKTLPFITCYEKARVLGERARQINNGSKPLVKIEESVIDGYLIALKEFEEKKIPFILQRPLPNGVSEYWRLKDLEII